ncbi:hypothetical protein JGH11_09075 [Dysgonomonas sp. Marseille-P4677]|uniref:DUF5683 domain-containing protein n=1 Tax=Dysgonomonas sp. Marseille-P4677 TaxID=2364790 RepID=UPI00191284D8|nr:DUF5683 domain-containing protein [Dysgonomonas sp. Marseille-P4677]MBK5721019.1 hypothetical protein [Dysgonomonas sp. Marseille-P4677]
MRKRLIICASYIIAGVCLSLHAQESNVSDSSRSENRSPILSDKKNTIDTVAPIISEKKVVLVDSITFNKNIEFKPDSKKAVIYSAIFPGLGQLYNRKYWKLPIVYGGVLGLTYAITWNGRTYGDYKQAFNDLVLQTGDSYKNYYSGSPDDYPGGRQGFQDLLKRRKDFYRRNRDLAIIVAVGVYGLCMLDAYVDAQLYDFDMSPDLSMRVTPVFWPATAYSKAGFGLQCNIYF